MAKRQVRDQSGWCRHSKRHELCHATWETPSAIVTCDCLCHSQQPKPVAKGSGRVLVPKK